MNFEFSEEQHAISDMANSLFSDYCTDEKLLAYTEAGDTIMQGAWDSAKETGLHNLFVSEDLGGSGLGILDLMIVLVAQGRYLAQVPLWRNQVAIAVLSEYASEDLTALLQTASSGEAQITCASGQNELAAGAGLLLADNQLNGINKTVADTRYSRYALLNAEQNGDACLALVDLKGEGISLAQGIMNHGGMVADIRCENVTPLAVVSGDAVIKFNQLSIACLAALQLCVSERQLERTVEYVSERIQFDRAIATFQAVQMTLADCKIATEALKSCLWQLCYRIDAGLSATSEALATAYHACETGHIVGHKAQHVHGGFGVDISYPIYRFLYWSREIRSNLGGSQAVLESLGDWLSENDTLGWKYDLE